MKPDNCTMPHMMSPLEMTEANGGGGSLGGGSCNLSCRLEHKAVGFLGTSGNMRTLLDVDVVLIGAVQHNNYVVSSNTCQLTHQWDIQFRTQLLWRQVIID